MIKAVCKEANLASQSLEKQLAIQYEIFKGYERSRCSPILVASEIFLTTSACVISSINDTIQNSGRALQIPSP